MGDGWRRRRRNPRLRSEATAAAAAMIPHARNPFMRKKKKKTSLELPRALGGCLTDSFFKRKKNKEERRRKSPEATSSSSLHYAPLNQASYGTCLQSLFPQKKLERKNKQMREKLKSDLLMKCEECFKHPWHLGNFVLPTAIGENWAIPQDVCASLPVVTHLPSVAGKKIALILCLPLGK